MSRSARRAWKAAKAKHMKRGSVTLINICHDDWCGIYKNHPCNCSPVRIICNKNGKELARVDGAGFYDPIEEFQL